MCVYIYIYTYTFIHIGWGGDEEPVLGPRPPHDPGPAELRPGCGQGDYIYIYIYICCMCMYVCMYIYIYIYIHMYVCIWGLCLQRADELGLRGGTHFSSAVSDHSVFFLCCCFFRGVLICNMSSFGAEETSVRETSARHPFDVILVFFCVVPQTTPRY